MGTGYPPAPHSGQRLLLRAVPSPEMPPLAICFSAYCPLRCKLHPLSLCFSMLCAPGPLPPEALDILLVLIRSNGRLRTKDELMQEVWPDSFVEESNLAVHISALRKVLGETAGGPQYIETVPRRGYRFVAQVTEHRD